MRRNEHVRYIDRSRGRNLHCAQAVYAGGCDRQPKQSHRVLAGACHRAGQRPDPLGPPDDKTVFNRLRKRTGLGA
jgi:hypothetical protein